MRLRRRAGIGEEIARLAQRDIRAVNTLITLAEEAVFDHSSGYGALREKIQAMARDVPVVGITGTGGAGKSSLIDELVLRFNRDFADKSVAILAVDPSRPHGRGFAGRPHPDERDQFQSGLYAFAGHPRFADELPPPSKMRSTWCGRPVSTWYWWKPAALGRGMPG